MAAVNAAAQRLRVDFATAEALRVLAVAGVPNLLLKGPSVARWLYEPEEGRAYMDCDLLVPSRQFKTALEELVKIGFQPELEEADMPEWWREHALSTFRELDSVIIDLHRTLPGVQVPEERLWATLSEATDTITVGDAPAHVLSEGGRVLHAALHAAQHGGTGRDLDVLERALDQVGEDEWRSAAALADTLDATAAFERGLRFLPEGAVLADRLGLHAEPVIDVEIRATGVAEALTLARLLRARSLSERLALVRHKLVPPPTFMRKWSPLARHGRLGLALSYLWRLIWVIGRTPPALQALLHARVAHSRQKS